MNKIITFTKLESIAITNAIYTQIDALKSEQDAGAKRERKALKRVLKKMGYKPERK